MLVVAGLVSLVISGAYYVGTIGGYGRTLGMAALGIRVVDAGGAIPGFPRATNRWLLPAGCGLAGAIPFFGSVGSIVLLLDYVSMLWSPQKQCWHDQWAQTWVVHAVDPFVGPRRRAWRSRGPPSASARAAGRACLRRCP